MTDVSEEEIFIRNEMYETLMESGKEILCNTKGFPIGKSPLGLLDENIRFFKSLGDTDSSKKCYDLELMRKKFIEGAI
jgi:hypothetical protein